jgi:uncharacterized protein YdeI (YjbR/CyaY-like superfamily)
MASPPPDSIHPKSIAAWRAWLAKHHTRTEGIWLISFKKATGQPRMEYGEAVEEALCFGWVDSLPRKLDAERSMLYFAPRKPRTGWSKPNKERVAKLIHEKRMMPAGLAKVEQAKADGSWTKLDAVEALTIPDDLADALTKRPPACENFAAFPRSVKRGILEWILQAKKEETRARRIEETATLAAKNKRANQWRGKP